MKTSKAAFRKSNNELIFKHLTGLAALILLFTIAGILAVVLWGAWPSLNEFGFSFMFSSVWDPVANIYGAVPALIGTVVTSVLSLAISAPLGIGTAIFLSELSLPQLKKPVSFMIELLAAVPSVVYGVWGIFVLVPWIRTGPGLFLETHLGFLPIFQGPSIGVGVLSASLLLSVMVLPTITAISREVIKSVPVDLREGMYALGATRWEVISRVILPVSKVGISGAILLAFGRAIGEAMAVTMIIGNANIIPHSILSPAQTIASLIVNEFPEAFDLHLSSLLFLGLILFIITLIINAAAVWLVYIAKMRLSNSRNKKRLSLQELSLNEEVSILEVK